MFDWNGNGRIDMDDHAFTAFMIDEMNKKNEADNHAKTGFPDGDDTFGNGDLHNSYRGIPDYSEREDDY